MNKEFYHNFSDKGLRIFITPGIPTKVNPALAAHVIAQGPDLVADEIGTEF
jgi:hypothetical protein